MSTTVCNGVSFTLSPTNGTNGNIIPAGTTYSWDTPTTSNSDDLIGGASANNSLNIYGTLFNSSNPSSIQTATYSVTPVSGNCIGNPFTASIAVNFASSINTMTTTVCSGTSFSVVPQSGINGSVSDGTKYSWSIPNSSGGITGGMSGANANTINGTLYNSTSSVKTATYIVSPYSGCLGTNFQLIVSVNPTATIGQMSTTSCNGIAFSVSPVDGSASNIVPIGTTYSWTVPTVTGGISGAMSGTNAGFVSGRLFNPTNIVQSATYSVTPISGNCVGSSFTVIDSVNPIATIAQLAINACSGVSFSMTPTQGANGYVLLPGTTYSWNAPSVLGGSALLTGGTSGNNISSISGTLSNTTSSLQVANYLVTPVVNGCVGNVFTAVVSVNPVASISDMSSTFCSGLPFSLTPLDNTNGIVPLGTTFTWTAPTVTGGIIGGLSNTNASNTAITGTLLNPTNVLQTANYTVTPSTALCGTGAPFSVTITVNFVASINALYATTCNGVGFSIQPYNGVNGIVPVGTTYTWTAPTVTGGITGGLSNTIASNTIIGSLINPTNRVQTATYSVTPYSGCTGASFTLTITLDPSASLAAMSTTTCSGIGFEVSPVNGDNGNILPSGTVYQWSMPGVNPEIGGMTGSSNYVSSITGTLTNLTSTAQTTFYTVSPSSNGCLGNSFTVTVNLNPIASINPLSLTNCTGLLFNLSPADGLNGIIPAGTSYSWGLPLVTGGITGGISSTNANFISGTLINPTSSQQSATYTVYPSNSLCGQSTPFTVNVNVNPSAMVSPMSATACSGLGFTISPTDQINGVVPAGTTYSWSVPAVSGGITGGLSGTQSSNINGKLFNPTTSQYSATYNISTVSGNCTGNIFSLTLSLNPNAVIHDTLISKCSGINFSVTPQNSSNDIIPAGTLYSWNTPISSSGITGGMSGTLASRISGNLLNATSSTLTATYIITPYSGVCIGSNFTLTVNVNPLPAIEGIVATACSGAPFSITPIDNTNGIVPQNTLYIWTWNTIPSEAGKIIGGQSQTNIRVPAITGNLTNTTNSAQTAVYTVTPIAGSCVGSSFAASVIVNPTPFQNNLTTVSCSGAVFTLTPVDGSIDGSNNIIPAGTTYSWNIPTGGLSSINGIVSNATSISDVLNNPINTALTATYTVIPVAGNCTGANFSVTVSVNPIAVINPMSLISCSGVSFATSPINLVNNNIVPQGTVYSWTVPTVSNGLTGGLSGTGSYLSDNLTNTTSRILSAFYTVTPLSGNCTGSSFTLTANISNVAQINDINGVSCTGVAFQISPTDAINGLVPASTTYSWIVPTVTGGLSGGMSNANASYISGVLTNPTNTQQTATYRVTPISDGNCLGSSFSVTITVNPSPFINTMTAVVCSGAGFTLTPVSGSNNSIIPAGTTYSWSTPTGGPVSSAGGATYAPNISDVLTNATSSALTATYQVIPNLAICGTTNSFTVTVTVNPVAAINDIVANSCSGAIFSVSPLDGINGIVPSGTLYGWSILPVTTGGLSSGITVTGLSSITATLVNPTNIAQTATYIVSPVSGVCQGSMFTVTMSINPVAGIAAMSSVTCGSVPFQVLPLNGINGSIPASTTYSWNLPAISTGITGQSAGANASSITGVLNNASSQPLTATYTVVPLSGNCIGQSFSVTILVNPNSSINAMTAVSCSGVAFSMTPIDGINGVVPSSSLYTWDVPMVTGGVSGEASSGNSQSNINGILVNSTSSVQTATYTITPIVGTGSCVGSSFTLTVTINPVAQINSMTAASCSGVSFQVNPVDNINGRIPAGTLFTWTSPIGSTLTGGNYVNTPLSNIQGSLTNPGNATLSATYTVSPVSGNCMGAVFSVTISIYPVPQIPNQVYPSAICSGSGFSFLPATGLIPVGTLYTWNPPVANPSGSVTNGQGQISLQTIISEKSLLNNLATVSNIIYTVSPYGGANVGGCAGPAFLLTVPVNPQPILTQTSANAICNNGQVVFNPSSLTSGVSYTWNRAVQNYITDPAANGTNGISENLQNSGTDPVLVSYQYILTANGCSNSQTFQIIVNPDPQLSSPTTNSICSGSIFNYSPSSLTNGVIYAWNRSTISDIRNLPNAGNGNIFEALVNNSNTPVVATYQFTLTYAGCTHSQNVSLIVIL